MNVQQEKNEKNKEKSSVKRWFSFHKPKEKTEKLHMDKKDEKKDEKKEEKKEEDSKKNLKNSFASFFAKLSISKSKAEQSPRKTLFHTLSAREKRISKEGSSHSRKSDNQSTDSSLLRDIIHTESDWSDDEEGKNKRGSEKYTKYISPRVFDERRSSYEPNLTPSGKNTGKKFSFSNFKTPKTPPTTPNTKPNTSTTPRSVVSSPGSQTLTPRSPNTNPRSKTPTRPIILTNDVEEVKKEKKLPLVKRRSKSVQEANKSNEIKSPGLFQDILSVKEEKKEEKMLEKKEEFLEVSQEEKDILKEISAIVDKVEEPKITMVRSPKFISIQLKNSSGSSSEKELVKKGSFGNDLTLTDCNNTMTYNDDSEKGISEDEEEEEKDHPSIILMMKKREDHNPTHNND